MRSYDYTHRTGVCSLSWDDFVFLGRKLAEAISLEGVDLIIGVARGGLFPATAVACALRLDLYPVRVTRRVNDRVVYSSPQWKTPVPSDVHGKMVAVIDEIVDTGETLRLVAEEVKRLGARQVITASLVSHSWASPLPRVTALVSDALVIFPWDAQVLIDGAWTLHPELMEAMAQQEQH